MYTFQVAEINTSGKPIKVPELTFFQQSFLLSNCIGPSLLILLPFVITGWIYSRLSNKSAGRDYEKRAEWQLAEFIKRQSHKQQTLYQRFIRIRKLSLILYSVVQIPVLLTVYLSTHSIYFLLITTSIIALTVLSLTILGNIVCLYLKAGIFPKYLWVGDFLFSNGYKARFAAYSQIAVHIIVMSLILFIMGFTTFNFSN
jgi:hypothetical protein